MPTAPRRLILPALAVACAAVGGATVARSAAPAKIAAAPSSIALVNLEKLFDNLNELKDRNKALDAVRETYTAQVRDLDTKAKGIEADLKERIPVTDRQKRAEKAAELTEARAILKVRAELLEGNMERKNAEIIRDLYEKAGKALGEFAEREGYDLVLLDDRSLDIPEGTTVANLNKFILDKRVLFAKPGVDITDRLISQMNTEYASGARPGQ